MKEIDDLIAKILAWPGVSLAARLAPFYPDLNALLLRGLITKSGLSKKLSCDPTAFGRSLKVAEEMHRKMLDAGIDPKGDFSVVAPVTATKPALKNPTGSFSGRKVAPTDSENGISDLPGVKMIK